MADQTEQPVMTADKDGNKFWKLNDVLHRTDGPAIEWADGSKAWCINGGLHRTDGPAYEGTNGNKAWYIYNVKYNHEDWKELVDISNNFKKLGKVNLDESTEQPVMTVDKNGDKRWRLNGEYHRTDGPAIEWADGSKAWYINGERHRTDGPAFEYANGDKAWYINGNLHRTDGPAYEGADGSKSWWINGERHRTDGPAIEWADGSKIWCINDIQYSYKDWKEMANISNNFKKLGKVNLDETTEQPVMTVDKNGDKQWTLNGKLHRTDGPAIERKHGYKAWCINGQLHRTDGPAFEDANGSKAWFLNGIKYPYEDWKAMLNISNNFMKLGKVNLDEAIDTGDKAPELFHKSKQAKYSTPLGIEKILPNLGGDAKRYIETVTSDSYKKTIERLEHYTGKPAHQFNLPKLMSTVMNALQKVQVIQKGHEKELEKLAVDIVLNLPEFKMFKNLVDQGLIKFDAKLEDANIQNAITEQEQQEQQERPQNQNELTGSEELNVQLANQLDDNNLKRQFANMITQGNAVNKLYLFQLASDSLNKIDPNLIKLYGIMSVMVQASYYAIPDMPLTNAMKGSAVGSEEIEPNDDGTYTIVARSPFFPYLVHEIVKGLYDYLSMDIVSQSQLDDETLDSELVDIMSGPALYTNLAKLIPQKDIEYLPLVFKLMLGLDVNTIKEILSGGGKTQMHIQKLLQQAKDLQNDYEKEEYED